MDEVFHQRVHLVLGPVPVLDGKRVESQVLDSKLAGGADDYAGGFSPRPMTLNSRKVALPGPAAIAVHDNGHVGRKRGLGFRAEMGAGSAHPSKMNGLFPSRADRGYAQLRAGQLGDGLEVSAGSGWQLFPLSRTVRFRAPTRELHVHRLAPREERDIVWHVVVASSSASIRHTHFDRFNRVQPVDVCDS